MTESRIAAPVRVLVADREKAFQKEIAEALTLKGFAVELSENAEDTFDKARVFLPNIMLYDLDLPGYGGLEALTLISKMRSGKESFLIALSSRQADDAAKAALEAGAWDFMSKPAISRDILQVALDIKRHLARAARTSPTGAGTRVQGGRRQMRQAGLPGADGGGCSQGRAPRR